MQLERDADSAGGRYHGLLAGIDERGGNVKGRRHAGSWSCPFNLSNNEAACPGRSRGHQGVPCVHRRRVAALLPYCCRTGCPEVLLGETTNMQVLVIRIVPQRNAGSANELTELSAK